VANRTGNISDRLIVIFSLIFLISSGKIDSSASASASARVHCANSRRSYLAERLLFAMDGGLVYCDIAPIIGSERESVRTIILRGFLNNKEFGLESGLC
jgi:hypothetical protein